jgi:hypothetical protein
VKKENESKAKKKSFLYKFFNVIQLRGEKDLSLKAKKENKTIIAIEQQLQLKQKTKRMKQKKFRTIFKFWYQEN